MLYECHGHSEEGVVGEVSMNVMLFPLGQKKKGKDFIRCGTRCEHGQRQQRWEGTGHSQKRGWGSVVQLRSWGRMGSKVGQDREGLRCLAKGLELVEPGKSTVGSIV